MADKKISELNSLTGANAADGDLVAIVDVSATETKKITRSEFFTDTPSIDVGGTVTATGFVTTGNMNFGDNDKAIFGAGSDLQIYHEGSHSFIDEVGDGRLYIRASDGIFMSTPSNALYLSTFDTGGVALYHNGVKKFDTTATGIDVTGTVTADGLTVVQNSASLFSSLFQNAGTGTVELRLAPSAYPNNIGSTARWASIQAINEGAGNPTSLAFLTNPISEDPKERLRIASNGDISFYEDTGTTPKFFWDASAERLNLTGDDDFQFSIKQGANEAWFLRAVSDGRFSLHLNGTGDIVTATSTGLGIGTVSPAATLDVNGTIKLDGNYPVGTGNVALGDAALDDGSLSGGYNTAIGGGSFGANTTGLANVGVGYFTGRINTSGSYNVFIGGPDVSGYNSGWGNTTGSSSVAIGAGSLGKNSTGGSNVALGHQSLNSNTTASNNTAVGFKAGYSGTTASENVIIGTNAGYSIATGVNNTFVGGADPASAYGAGGAITTGSKNTIIGRYDGNQGGLDIRTASNNIVLSDGDGNPRLLIDSSGNVGIGTNSPQAPLNVYGSDGIVLNLTNTSWKTAQIKPIDEGGSFKGSLAFFTHPTNGSPTTPVERLRIDSSGNVGIGTTSPAYKLVVSAAGASGIEFAPAYSGTANLVQHYSRSGGVYVDAVNEAAQHRFNIAGTERMRIDSSGNVGIGTSSPDSYNASADNLVVGTTSGNNGITIATGTANQGSLFFADGTASGAEQAAGFLFYAHTSNFMAFGTTNTERMRIDSSGNLLVGTTSAGTMSGDGVIGVGERGGIITNSSNSVADSGTLDLAINTGGGGYQGFLIVTNTLVANANVRTHTTFSVFGRGTDSSIQQIATDNGSSGGATFTVTTPSNGVIRVTNTSGSTTGVAIQFFGGTSL